MALPVDKESFRKHAVIVGASGSGKTVAAKHVLEELILDGVKVIAVDPQGDIASMCLPSTDAAFNAKARRVYTPGSDAGLRLSLNPLTMKPGDDRKAVPAVAHNVAGILGYDVRNAEGRAVIAALRYALDAHRVDNCFESLEGMRDYLDGLFVPSTTIGPSHQDIELHTLMKNNAKAARRLGFNDPDPKPLPKPVKTKAYNKINGIISDKHLKELIRRLSQVSMDDVYTDGHPLSIHEMLESDLSVVYLNSLYSPEQRMAVVASVATGLYQYMLKNPEQKLHAVLYIDEVSMFLPSGTKMTAAKETLKLLFQQGRKYGVGVILATQSPGGVDYHAMSQASTWMIGKLTMRQDLNKIKPQYANVPDRGMQDSNSGELSGEAINDLPTMDVGQFQIISPDNFQGIRVYRFPMPRTAHETLSEFDLERAKK